MTRTNIHVVKCLMEHYLDGDVNEGMAGGTTTLSLVRRDGTVVCVTEVDGPFGRIDEDGFTEIDGFMLGVYEDWDGFLAGDEPIGGLDALEEIRPEYDHLVELLETVGKEAAK